MSVLFTPGISGAVASVTDYNNNLNLLESSFGDLGPYVISGLAVSIGVGLAVNVASGTASIGGEVVSVGFSIGGLTPSTTNHLYLLQNGTGTANTTGTAPANSVKLGTCVTSGGAVSSVAQNWGSGRQQFVQPQSLVLGSGAGNPRSLNLASWAASGSEGQECVGVLPAGAQAAQSFAGLSDVSESGVAQGDVLYYDGAHWKNLAHGTAGQVLISNGAAANPAWSSTPTLGALTLAGDLTLSTHNLVTDTTTGTQIGTAGGAAGQKLGFYGAAPVVQPLLATGAAHTVDDVITALQTLGLCRQT